MLAEPQIRRLARSAGMPRREITTLVELGVVRVDDPAPEVLVRLRRAHRLRRDLGLELDVVALVMRLLDRIEELETARRH